MNDNYIITSCRICGQKHRIKESKVNTMANMCNNCYEVVEAFKVSFEKRMRADHHHKPVGNCSWEEFRTTLLKFKLKCAYSNQPLTIKNYEIEHLIPTTDKENSSSTAPNLLPVTRSVNKSKRDKSFLEWYNPTLPYYSEARKEYIIKNHYYPAIEARKQAQKEAEEHYRLRELKRLEEEARALKIAQEEEERRQREEKRREEERKHFEQMIEEAREKERKLMTPNRVNHLKRVEELSRRLNFKASNYIEPIKGNLDIFEKPFKAGARAEIFSLGRMDLISVDGTRTRVKTY